MIPITAGETRAVHARLRPFVVRTPIVAMTPSGYGPKAESLQPTGAFKSRGALLALPDEQRTRGVVAHSSGNHAQAVAYAAHVLGAPAVIIMPDNAPAAKLAATRR
jgi:threonine dehydratase